MILDQIPAREWKDLAIAWVGTSLAFTPILAGMTKNGIINGFVLSLVTVGIAFIVHECAHKFVAIRQGYWAEFKRNDIMIALAILMGWTMGIVIAAPGAATIFPRRTFSTVSVMGPVAPAVVGYGGMTTREMGLSAAAGPVSNIVLCFPFLALGMAGGFLGLIGMLGASVNAFFALFNMIPFGPFDGKKVFSWNKVAFIAIVVVSLVLFLSINGFLKI